MSPTAHSSSMRLQFSANSTSDSSSPSDNDGSSARAAHSVSTRLTSAGPSLSHSSTFRSMNNAIAAWRSTRSSSRNSALSMSGLAFLGLLALVGADSQPQPVDHGVAVDALAQKLLGLFASRPQPLARLGLLTDAFQCSLQFDDVSWFLVVDVGEHDQPYPALIVFDEDRTARALGRAEVAVSV